MVISPDVVSFVHHHFGRRDLLWRSGVRNVAGKASSVSLATGMARNVACCTAVLEMECPWPLYPLRRGASLFVPSRMG